MSDLISFDAIDSQLIDLGFRKTVRDSHLTYRQAESGAELFLRS